VDENTSVMNKYTELCYAAARSLLYKAQETGCQLLVNM